MTKRIKNMPIKYVYKNTYSSFTHNSKLEPTQRSKCPSAGHREAAASSHNGVTQQ